MVNVKSSISNPIKALSKLKDGKLSFENYIDALCRFNMRESLLEIAKMSGDIFWNNTPDSPLYINKGIKKYPLLDNAPYHQYGLAFAAYALLLSRANDHKTSKISEPDCVYLCNIYDQKLFHVDLKSIDDLEEWITRLFHSRFRFDLLPVVESLGKSLVLYLDTMSSDALLKSKFQKLLEKFTDQYGFTPEEYFKYCFLLAIEAHNNYNQVDIANIDRGCLKSMLEKDKLKKIISELTCTYETFRGIDLEENSGPPGTEKYCETRINPLSIKPLIQTKLDSSKYILVNYHLYYEKIFFGIYSLFESIDEKFRRKFYGPAIESYCGDILKVIFPEDEVIDEFHHNDTDKFFDFTVVCKDRIYFFEIKSKQETMKFKSTGDFRYRPKVEEIESLEKQMDKISLVSSDELFPTLSEKLGADFMDKKHINFMVLDIESISNPKFRKRYLSDSIVEKQKITKTQFISLSDLEEYSFSETSLSIEEVCNEIEVIDSPNNPASFKTVLRNNSQLNKSKNIARNRFNNFMDYIMPQKL